MNSKTAGADSIFKQNGNDSLSGRLDLRDQTAMFGIKDMHNESKQENGSSNGATTELKKSNDLRSRFLGNIKQDIA